MDKKGSVTLDARGLGCPKPVIMAEEVVSKISEGIVDVLVDNEASVGNLSKFAKNNALYAETEKIENYWKIRLVKDYSCEVSTTESPGLQALSSENKEKGVLLVIGTDTIGKDEALGKILMKGFFETMEVTKELPHTIFFLNTGVRLTTVESDIIPVLKNLESMGVEIYSCGTCLEYLTLLSELKVGHRGTTNHIVEGIKDFIKVVWI